MITGYSQQQSVFRHLADICETLSARTHKKELLAYTFPFNWNMQVTHVLKRIITIVYFSPSGAETAVPRQRWAGVRSAVGNCCGLVVQAAFPRQINQQHQVSSTKLVNGPRRVTMTTVSSQNGSTTLSRMNLSGHVGYVVIFIWLLATAFC